MKLYIWLKWLINKLFRNISSLKEEILFVRDNFLYNYEKLNMKILEDHKIKYIPDYLFSKHGPNYKADIIKSPIWDWQYSSDVLVKHGGGDCNSIHRLFQMFYYLKDWNSYLVTIITDDMSKHHTTCIIERDRKFKLIDYDTDLDCETFTDCINAVQKKYNIHKILSITSQDIYWKIIKSKDI